ncbi:MAG: tetratricopeptide repeat protein, partial [Proteobacteria bacterium]|nr:tetratricopeptide repeat protein [Pseudomonadota bacterium]
MLTLRHLHYLLLLILGFIIYRGAIGGPFIFDDNQFILENLTIRSLSNFTDLSGTRYISFLSFAMNYAVDGYNAAGYKITNIAIHIVNSILVYKFVSTLIETPTLKKARGELKYLAVIVSLLFLTHPIATQAVNYTFQRSATLATLFYLLSITLYLKARLMGLCGDKEKNPKRYALYAFALLAAIIAQKTKEISFTLPFMIVLFDMTLLPASIGIKSRLKNLLPFLFTLAIIPASILLPSSGGALNATGGSETVRRIQIEILTEQSRHDYLITQFKVVPIYFKLLFFPTNQNLLHDITTYDSFFNPQVLVSFVFLAVIFAFAIYLLVRSIKRKEAASFLIGAGILWFFITISMESSIIPLKYKMFEHRAYLPSVGFFISTATAFLYISRAIFNRGERRSPLPLVIAIIVITVLSFLSYQRSSVWKDKFSIWSDTVAKSPGNSKAHNELGTAYMELGKTTEALKHYKEAIRINPRSGIAIVNLGSAL